MDEIDKGTMKYNSISVNCLLINILFVVAHIIQWSISEYVSVEILQLEYLIYVFFLLGSLKYRKLDICSIYGLFILTYQVFLGSTIIMNAVGIGPSFAETNFFTGFTFELDIQKYMIIIISVSLAMVDTGLLMGTLFWGWRVPQWKANPCMEKFAFRGMCLTFVLALIGDYQYIQTIASAGGYLSIYLDNDIQKPFLSKMDTFFFLFGYMYMVSAPARKYRTYFIIMYVSCCLGKALCGSRGDGIASLMLLIWWFNLYVKTISIKKLIASSLCLMLFAMIAGMWRGSMNLTDLDLQENIFYGDSPFVKFIVGQSISSSIVGYTIYYEDEIKNMGATAILYPFSNYWGIAIMGNIPDLVSQADKSLGAYISYLSNPIFYFSGMGLGTAFPAELFAVGDLFGVIVGSFLLGIFLVLGVNKLQYKWQTWIILFSLFNNLLLIPRNSYFAFFPGLPHLVRNIFIMYLIFELYKRVRILPRK